MSRRQRKIKTEIKEDDDVEVVMVASGSDHAVPEGEVTSGNIASQQGESSADDDDEIVREIPVFLSQELSSQLQLVQFPLQQRQNQLFPNGPDAVRVKPRHCMMEIDFPTPGNIQYNGMYHMPSRTFASQTIPVSTHMALGKMVEMETNGKKSMGLHLVPLSRMMQMRPIFSHIDEAAEASTATTEDELKQQQQEPQNNNERKSVTFRKKESERQELARKSSYGYKKASEDAEGWHSLEVYDEASLQANLVLDKVACPVEHQSNNLLDVEGLEKSNYASASNKKIQGTSLNATYLNTLNYLPPREDSGAQDMGKLDISDNNNQGEDNLALVVSKLVKLMRLGVPIPFSLLRTEFPEPTAKGGGISDTSLCVALGSCAVLVRGNWCLNSKLLAYPKAMTQARTFLLCLFQSMGVVHRERLMKVFEKEGDEKTSAEDDAKDDDRVTSEVIEMLLEQLGEKASDGWVLKVADDLRFTEEHPQTTLVHLQYWAKQIELFRPMIETYRSDF